MKKILLVTILVLVGLESGVGQCHPITQMYSRQIQATHWTYGYNGQTSNARYKDGTPVLPEHVDFGIHMAVTAWTNAANSEGTAITLTETDYNSAQLRIYFEDLGFPCGEGTSTDIKINSTYRFDGVSSLWSAIIHEMGHAFLGSGHHGNGGIMSCAVGADCDKKVTSLSPEEIARTLELYNPRYTVTVKNDFGPAANQGGSVIVDQVTYHNIPVAGKEFVWRTHQLPHTITGVDYQEIPENNVVYVREYQRWTRASDHFVMAERPVLSFGPPVEQATYTASFFKLFNVTFADPVYVESGGSGGYYTVEGEPASSTVILQHTSKLIAAVPPEGWFFMEWNDNHPDKYTNPRELAPTDHVENLSATFKKHLGSSIPTATSTNSQRKYAADVGTLETKVALSYTSAGEIWLTESNTFGSGFGLPSVVAAGRSDQTRGEQLPRAGRDFT